MRTDTLLSPSLVVDRSVVLQNLESMMRIARGPERLRPHVKTHKMPAIVRLAESLGITKHKCATIAEAEMVAAAGGTDVLLAYPIVGPNIARLARLIRNYPGTTFRAARRRPRRRPGAVGRDERARTPAARPGRPGGRHGADGDRARRRRPLRSTS